MFEIEGKIALISGGASGIGFKFVQELLRNGLRGVTIADINEELGKDCLEEIKNKFGPNRAIFVKTDVVNYHNYEEAFKQTIQQFQNLDIVINNAGVVCEYDWDKVVAVNLTGVINGTLLALENYIKKHKSGAEGVIVNLSSIAGVLACPSIPIYTATKFGVVGLSTSLGHQLHYDSTKIKVLAVCPGMTDTPLIKNGSKNNLGERYQTISKNIMSQFPVQSSDSVAVGLVDIVQNGKTGTIWIVEDDKAPYEYTLALREDFAPK